MCQMKTDTKHPVLKAWLTAVQTVNLSYARKKKSKQSVFCAGLQPLYHMMWHSFPNSVYFEADKC